MTYTTINIDNQTFRQKVVENRESITLYLNFGIDTIKIDFRNATAAKQAAMLLENASSDMRQVLRQQKDPWHKQHQHKTGSEYTQ